MTARWIDRSTMNIGRRRLLASVLLLVLIPTAASAHGTSKPAAMTTIAPGSTVISLPFWGTEDRAIELQAQTGFRFKLIDHWKRAAKSLLPSRRSALHADLSQGAFRG